MTIRAFFIFLFLLSLSALLSAQSESEKLRDILMPYFVPVKIDTAFLISEKKKIYLGKSLFYDNRLSNNLGISCNSCHDLEKYGTNGSLYTAGRMTVDFYRDVPTLYNISTLPIFNADGGISSLKDKISQSLESSHEMGIDKQQLLKSISLLDAYKKMFKEAYPNADIAITHDNIVNALETFIKGLVTPAAIDRFMEGDMSALSKEQIEGGHIFNSKSCYSCHTGSNIGGQMIQKLGVAEEWPNQMDLGYYQIKKESVYKMFFRVSALRNIEKTAPYFHDASSNKLWKAIQRMGVHERGLDISIDEALKIEEFLKALTGTIPYSYIDKTNLN